MQEPPKTYQKINFVASGQFQNSLIASQKQLQAQKTNSLQIQSQLTLHNAFPKPYPIGPGLINKGNTCFLNAVLQALSYTPPLASYCLLDLHQQECKKQGNLANNFCCLCAFQTHVKTLFPREAKQIAPNGIIRNMRYIFKRFRLGRQEDSHEFLRLMVESLQRGALPLNQKLEHNDTISKIFNGKLKSQVKCMQCGYKSEILENFFDLSLELQNCKDLDQCIQKFFKIEELGGKNKYKCSGCHKFVNAQKKFLINDLPNVLTCHLKRFDNFMQKIHKQIQFPTKVNLQKYVCENRPSVNASYDLYCVLVHAGGTTTSGHYYCYVKNSNGLWYCMNDESVSQTPINKILQEKAYILFYNRIVEQKPQQQKSDKSNSVVLEVDFAEKQKQEASLMQENQQKLRKLSAEGQILENGEKKNTPKNLVELQQKKEYKDYMQEIDNQFNIKKQIQLHKENIAQNQSQRKLSAQSEGIQMTEEKQQDQKQLQQQQEKQDKQEQLDKQEKQEKLDKQEKQDKQDKLDIIQKQEKKIQQEKQQESIKIQEQKAKSAEKEKIEVEEPEYQEEQIIIPGDIFALRQMKKSKLHKIRYIQSLEEKRILKNAVVKKRKQINEEQLGLVDLQNPEIKDIKVNIVHSQNEIQPKKSLLKKQSHYDFDKKEQKEQKEQKQPKQEQQQQKQEKVNQQENLEKAKIEIEEDQKFDNQNLRKIKNFAGNSLNRARTLTTQWDDADEEEIEEKKKIYEQNKDILEYKQAVKDEYDLEYDQGKVKKIKEKNLEKQVINFQQLYEENKTADFSEEGQLKAQQERQKQLFKDKKNNRKFDDKKQNNFKNKNHNGGFKNKNQNGKPDFKKFKKFNNKK